MRVLRPALLVMCLALLLPVGFAHGQTSVNANVTITIPQVLSISVDETSITFPAVAASDFETGWIAASQASVVTHRGNIVHDVEIAAGAATMTPTSGTYNKPASDFEWSVDGGSTFFGISTAVADVVTAAPVGAGNQTVNYRMLLDYLNDEPDTYTLGFTYTVVAN
jgi:hypothetical protein